MTSPREEWHFDTERIGRRVLVFDEVESTNSMAANAEQPDGLAILAGNQMAGRGRFGRVWRSRPGDSLLISVVLFPPPELRRPSILTAWAAVALGDAIYSLTGLQTRIKWPNDLLLRGQKVSGILIEQGAATIVGIGLNLNQTREEFDVAGLPDATSLAIASGKSIELRLATEVLLRHLDAEYARLLGGERVAVEADWKWRTGLLGQRVEIELSDGSRVAGRMFEMSFDGLEVELADGQIQTVTPERVEHVRIVE